MKKLRFLALPFLLGIFAFTSCNYNSLISLREETESAWANVENQYQKRYDLVPNLVNTVKGYAKQEESIFTQIADSRSKLGGQMVMDSSITEDPEKFAQFQQSQATFGATLGRLLSLTESYPELKSNQNFLDLQSQLEGIENRISTERKRYNDIVKRYNTEIQKFPTNLYASKMGFGKKEYFKSESAASSAPKVEF